MRDFSFPVILTYLNQKQTRQKTSIVYRPHAKFRPYLLRAFKGKAYGKTEGPK